MPRRVASIEAFQRKFGQIVRRRRERLALSQEELADRCGLHRTYISLLERGIKSPSLRVILLLAQGLGTPAHQLMKDAEDV